jgi:hypothetical protein
MEKDITVEVQVKLDSSDYSNTTELLAELTMRLDEYFKDYTIDNISYREGGNIIDNGKMVEREVIFNNKVFDK